MREIKFRVWDKRFGKYIDPSDVRLNVSNGEVHGRLSSGHVDAWELEQYTGIKDQTGKEIYEGDIINSHANFDNPYFRTVVMDEDSPCIEFSPLTGFNLCKASEKHFLIIGNIHENKELLK
ncbi:MAG: hypothetical protein B6I30_09540 [Desulfobacteraceae bacterium 4572_187]|nr:MAG: hypothetical protein B6I30_09540 [Desulfobacteraceae bacterium 4572_187]